LYSETAIAGEKYRGLWGGKAKSSFEILATSPLLVNYCYLGKCGKVSPSGNLNEMKWAFPGGKMTLKKVGNRYYGRHKLNNSSTVSQGTFLPQ
ncbi:MAG: hypothetical protein Q7T14_02680, partial [Aestuariivirga sp.]|nr:hypothetical protein [Aestuariivirga sp.]